MPHTTAVRSGSGRPSGSDTRTTWGGCPDSRKPSRQESVPASLTDPRGGVPARTTRRPTVRSRYTSSSRWRRPAPFSWRPGQLRGSAWSDAWGLFRPDARCPMPLADGHDGRSGGKSAPSSAAGRRARSGSLVEVGPYWVPGDRPGDPSVTAAKVVVALPSVPATQPWFVQGSGPGGRGPRIEVDATSIAVRFSRGRAPSDRRWTRCPFRGGPGPPPPV